MLIDIWHRQHQIILGSNWQELCSWCRYLPHHTWPQHFASNLGRLLNGSWDFIWVRSVRNSPSTIYSIHHWSESPRCGDYTYKCQALKIQHKNWSEGSYNSTSLWWPIRPNLVAVCNFLLFSSFCWCLSVLFTNSYLFTPFCWWQASLYIFWAYNIYLV